MERPDEHVPAAAELRRPADRPRARKACLPAAGEREHGDRVHLRPWRVRRLARDARQGGGRLRGGDPRPPVRERSARPRDRRHRRASQPAHLQRRHRPAAPEHRDRLGRVARGVFAGAPRRTPRPRRDLHRRWGARQTLGAARHRRGRHRVRRATCTTPKRLATWWRCAPNRASWGCIRTGARKASRPNRPGRKSSATTTART